MSDCEFLTHMLFHQHIDESATNYLENIIKIIFEKRNVQHVMLLHSLLHNYQKIISDDAIKFILEETLLIVSSNEPIKPDLAGKLRLTLLMLLKNELPRIMKLTENLSSLISMSDNRMILRDKVLKVMNK